MTTRPTPADVRIDDVLALTASDAERHFLRFEFERGIDYYVKRLDRLMLHGDAMLDAGCGAGQWSLAAARRFAQVDAIDLSERRLDILRALAAQTGADNIRVSRGSIEQLPYADDSFDVVVCYGVMMFTTVTATLAEFQRVLRPGGRVYVCLNGDGWSRHLIAERGPSEPHAMSAGQETLYNTHWRRAREAGLDEQLIRIARQLRAMLPAWLSRWRFGPHYRAELSARQLRNCREAGRRCLLGSTIGEALLRNIERDCGRDFAQRACADAWLVGVELASSIRRIPSEAFMPDELAALVSAAGFADFQWAAENELVCDWLAPATTPKYEPMFRNSRSVWEGLATKPDRRHAATASPRRHLDAARAAVGERVYLEAADPAYVSNGSWNVFPLTLLAQIQQLAVQLGGSRYLADLAGRLVDGAATVDEKARRLITFVQRAIFRDPISQPILADGSMPDSLTILLSARGRCGHTSQLLADLFRLCGIESRVRPLTNHMIAEALVDGRWVIADADAFKNGIIPVNQAGQILTMEEIQAKPHQLDRFPATGWMVRSGSKLTRGQAGGRVRGYVDALDPEVRGFVSGYYVPSAKGQPPPIPDITRFERTDRGVELEWSPSAGAIRYRVAIGTTTRGWSYDEPGFDDEILRRPGVDIADVTTGERRLAVETSAGGPLFAAVTAIGDRSAIEPATFYWPSDEATSER